MDPVIEKWIKAISLPMPISSLQGISEIPPALIDIARLERLANANQGREEITDSEIAIYLITKYYSRDFNKQEERVLGHLLYKIHERYFPDHDRGAFDSYKSMSKEDRQYLSEIRARLTREMEEVYKRTLKDYAEAVWRKYKCYLDPRFLAEKKGKRGNGNIKGG